MDDEKPIGDLLKNLMSSYQLGDKYDEISIVQSWEQIVGGVIARRTQKIHIKNKVLYIGVDSAPLKNELHYHKLVIIEKVNTFARKELIKDLKIYL